MELEAVDNRFPLCYYYRIADQIAKQAKVYREEANNRDLYVVLDRFVRLVKEIIPQHKSYPKGSSKDKLYYKKILQEFVKELEKLKPFYARKDRENDKKSTLRPQRSKTEFQKMATKRQAEVSCNESKIGDSVTFITKGNSCNALKETSGTVLQTPCSASTPTTRNQDINVHVVRQSFPSQILSCVESVPLVGQASQIVVPDSSDDSSSWKGSTSSKAIQDIHISVRLMEEFMELARSNTEKDLETCGVLGAFLNRTFYATTLIIPKQESTCSSCQALNEEEIYAIQEEHSLFPVGWIHTHPSQTCFLSSIDLHTQYSYQVMLPEAVAIVMAPTDATRNYGIFRLTDPGGISVLRDCQERGFHPHKEPEDGSPLYEHCSNVFVNPNLRFEIIDLRCT